MLGLLKNIIKQQNIKLFILGALVVLCSFDANAQSFAKNGKAGLFDIVGDTSNEELSWVQKKKVNIVNSDLYRTAASTEANFYYDDKKKEIQKKSTEVYYQTENKVNSLIKSGELSKKEGEALLAIYKEKTRIDALLENKDAKDFQDRWWNGDSDLEDWRKNLKTALENAQGIISNEDLKALQSSIDTQINKAYADLIQEAKDNNDTKAVEELIEGRSEANEEIMKFSCPSIAEMEMKYTSDCYSCLVVRSLLTAFLTAASKVYAIAQEAGLKLLGFGAVLWLLTFALQRLSSITSLEPANMVNELIKFGFKVLLAWAFITAGIRTTMQFFVEPFMGSGAVFAQQLWPQEIKQQTEDYIWEDYDYEDIDKKYEEAKKKEAIEEQKRKDLEQKAKEAKQATPAPSEEDLALKAKLEEAQKQKEKATLSIDGKSVNIPSFKIPGATGTFVSPFGCRPAPSTSGGKGSTVHKGVDIAGGAGTTIYAIASGKISYSNSDTGGYTAHIDHGGGWISIYHHMQSKSKNFATDVNKKLKMKDPNRVAQGQQIGFMGNTGNSGGVHLHLSVKYGGKFVDPLSLTLRKIVYEPKSCPSPTTQANRTPPPAGFVRDKTKVPEGGWNIAGMATEDLSSTFINASSAGNGFTAGFSGPRESIGDIKYDGPTDILSKSIINSILGATQVITNNMAKLMMVGNVITCFAEEENGGAWKLVEIPIWGSFHMTNIWLWVCGAAIWGCGFMLTLAVSYYLLDISFKIGFAVMALPIVMGLWPFNITKGKLSACMSIIFKASATFAFLAITTGYAMELVGAAIGNDSETGFMQAIMTNDSAYISNLFSIFNSEFYILIFCLIYSFKLIRSTIDKLTNKFFSDSVFGNASPMHSKATMATKIVKDKVMQPVGLARDIALHQTGKLAKNTLSGIKDIALGKKSAGKATQAAGKSVQAAGSAMEASGKAIKSGGAAVGAALSAIPVVGTAAGAAVKGASAVAGAAVQVAGKATKAAGKATEYAGKGAEKLGNAVRKTQQALHLRKRDND